MLDSGVIRGFTTVIDRNAVGWNTEAYVQVYCHGRISPDELRRAWIDIPEVVSAATATGTADAILHVSARDMRHLEDALERIRTSADIERTESIVVLSNLIDRSRAEDTAALHRQSTQDVASNHSPTAIVYERQVTSSADSKGIVIVGGGLAATRTAEQLRRAGYAGPSRSSATRSICRMTGPRCPRRCCARESTT